jgi:peptidoglycan/xylan/chitin deacetylase (PgdA/CDA1 family)
LLTPDRDRRHPRFAITFDDDYPQHVEYALPVLKDLGMPATFFLSGRALNGLGAHWWEYLEDLAAAEDIAAIARALGLRATTANDVLLACEGNPAIQARVPALLPTSARRPLDSAGILALVSAGMTIGFHTLEHPVLTTLGDDQLAATLLTGREDLAALVGEPVSLLAYPHGKADSRVARAACSAGYRAAWTGHPRPFAPGANPYLLGRWEPGPLDADAFLAELAVRLHRAAPPMAAPGHA